MVLRKNDKLKAGRPEGKSTQAETATGQQRRLRQLVAPAPPDDAESSAKPPTSPKAYGDGLPINALGTTGHQAMAELLRQLPSASAITLAHKSPAAQARMVQLFGNLGRGQSTERARERLDTQRRLTAMEMLEGRERSGGSVGGENQTGDEPCVIVSIKK
jgi:hypothetical protein